MPFDFEAAVVAPFRMQPGLRRVAAGTAQLTPMAPGGRHQREKLAVLSAFWQQALCAQEGFNAAPALHAVCTQAAAEHPQAWAWDGERAQALQLGMAAHADGRTEQTSAGSFGLGDEVARCLHGLPPQWRLAGLLCLSFVEDFAVLDGATGTLPWLAVTLPSHWAPEDKVGRHFAQAHGPVADNALLLKAADSLIRLVTGLERWERFVWTLTDHPRLHAHPARVAHERWQNTPVEQAFWRSEYQSFIPLPERQQAVFTIHVDVQPLADALTTTERAAALRAAIASMTPAVLDYRGLSAVREPLLAWLAERAAGA